MDKQKLKNRRALRRKRHIRKKVVGTPERPRLTVFRSNKHIYCQIIDDSRGRTVASASTLMKEARETLGGKGGNRQAAIFLGKILAERATASGITKVVFDRNGYRFHGRIADLARVARENGLSF